MLLEPRRGAHLNQCCSEAAPAEPQLPLVPSETMGHTPARMGRPKSRSRGPSTTTYRNRQLRGEWHSLTKASCVARARCGARPQVQSRAPAKQGSGRRWATNRSVHWLSLDTLDDVARDGRDGCVGMSAGEAPWTNDSMAFRTLAFIVTAMFALTLALRRRRADALTAGVPRRDHHR